MCFPNLLKIIKNYNQNFTSRKLINCNFQEKVRSQSPQLLTSRFLSPREIERELEKKKYSKKVKQLKNKVLKF